MATDARNLGMKGVLCPDPSWVAPVNAAFTPTADLVAYNMRVREVFAEAVAAGTAAGSVSVSILAADPRSAPRVTPAMEAGVSDHVWSLEEIAELAA